MQSKDHKGTVKEQEKKLAHQSRYFDRMKAYDQAYREMMANCRKK